MIEFYAVVVCGHLRAPFAARRVGGSPSLASGIGASTLRICIGNRRTACRRTATATDRHGRQLHGALLLGFEAGLKPRPLCSLRDPDPQAAGRARAPRPPGTRRRQRSGAPEPSTADRPDDEPVHGDGELPEGPWSYVPCRPRRTNSGCSSSSLTPGGVSAPAPLGARQLLLLGLPVAGHRPRPSSRPRKNT
jgi:hypothetical protein